MESPLQSLYTFMALQIARIHRELYPEYTNPRHVQGPRRPDLQGQEHAAFKKDR